MCGRPDVVSEYEYLDRVVLKAFWAYKDCMQLLYTIEEETAEKTDWIKTFCDGVSGRLRKLEQEGKLAEKQADDMID